MLGYDVADAWLGYSGFYGFTWRPGELSQVFAGADVGFNKCGLLSDETLAVRAAKAFTENAGTKSHGPFYPVRIWIESSAI